MAEQKENKLMRFGFYLLLALLLVNVFNLFFKQEVSEVDKSSLPPITLETTKSDFSIGSSVKVEITNNTAKNLRLEYECPDEPLTVLNTTVTPPQIVDAKPNLNCDRLSDPILKSFSLPANSSRVLSYDYWSGTLFDDLGRYKFIGTFTIDGEKFETSSNEFRIEERGIFRSIWYYLLYQPFYNVLVFLIKIVPGHSLAAGIIILTILIRIILLIPSQKALRAQKQLQEVQPKLEAIKNKYKGNQQKIAEETMKIWKENKVNPLGNCLPLLIQFPILLALFHVISNGVNASTSYVLYDFLSDFDYSSLQTVFLNILPLTEKNVLILPLIVGGLQFIQMKLSFSKNKKKPKSEKTEGPAGMDLGATQGLMTYFLPAMIAVFTASVPAGVGLYWGTSTLFAIGQQIVINKESKNDNSDVIEAEVVKEDKKK